MDCTGVGSADPGQYTNFAVALGNPPAGHRVFDVDPSHYYGAVPGVHLEKSTNGVDADDAPGPFVAVGSEVDWSYVVSNTGNSALSDVDVEDDQGVAVTCPSSTLAVGASMTCTGSGVAAEGQYQNLGTVTATDASAVQVSDTDPSHYLGSVSALTLTKFANGDDANVAPGIEVPGGEPVEMTFVVTNPGNVDVSNVVVSDDRGLVPAFVGGDENDDDVLQPGEEWTYRATTAPATGQDLDNVGTATGIDVLENELTASDPATVHLATPVTPGGGEAEPAGAQASAGGIAFSGVRGVLLLTLLGLVLIVTGLRMRRRRPV
jgi:hypothetical protein